MRYSESRSKIVAQSLFVVGACICVVLILSASTASARQPHFCRVDTAQGAYTASSIDKDPSARPPRGVVLLVNKAEAKPGSVIFARLANFGRKRASYGREFAIERRFASGWKVDPASPKGPWIRVASILKPSAAGRCYRFNVPADQPAGRYRFSTKVSPEIGRAPQRRTAIFEIR